MHEQGTKYRFNGNRRHGLQIRASGKIGYKKLHFVLIKIVSLQIVKINKVFNKIKIKRYEKM